MKITSADQEAEKLEPSHLEGMEHGAATVQESGSSSNSETELPYDPATPFLCTHEEWKHVHTKTKFYYSDIRSNIIHNSQQVGTTQVTIY